MFVYVLGALKKSLVRQDFRFQKRLAPSSSPLHLCPLRLNLREVRVLYNARDCYSKVKVLQYDDTPSALARYQDCTSNANCHENRD